MNIIGTKFAQGFQRAPQPSDESRGEKRSVRGSSQGDLSCPHPNVIALTFVLPLKDEVFTRELWERAAEILVKVLSMRPDKLQTITAQNFRDLAKDFHVTLPERFLYEKK